MFQQLEAIFGRAPPDAGRAFNRSQECHVKADARPGAPASSLARRLVGLMADKGKGLEQICAYLILTAQQVADIVAYAGRASLHSKLMRQYKSSRFWSISQIRLLIELWPSELPIEEIVARINRDRVSVLTKARSLGFRVRTRHELQALARESTIGTSVAAVEDVPCARQEGRSQIAINVSATTMDEISREYGSSAEDAPKSADQIGLVRVSGNRSAVLAVSRRKGRRQGRTQAKAPVTSRTIRARYTEEIDKLLFTYFDRGETSTATAIYMDVTEGAVRSRWSNIGLSERDSDKMWNGAGPSPYAGAAAHLVITTDKHTHRPFWCHAKDKGLNWYSPATRKTKWARDNGIAKRFGGSARA
jgi:hypothetical protein